MLMSDAPGFPCPSCKAPISTTLQSLFSGRIYCSNCKLELRLEEKASREALTAAHRLDDSIQKAEAMKADALDLNHVQPKAPERSRSRPRRP
ncbi:hypothetical protein POL68_16990 [Stigmatella sp. ncwal1]|uniref:Uncharacterized protein n=1 Tax=Stigmatella ashevillensis TaxID=2995309 RepID=A0ABT5DCV1_9BACT|nr:hypothetical protein [Stigmatella ashevillena]MDC0710176.1 hypothetical protein [Stigmatella ashevillena]